MCALTILLGKLGKNTALTASEMGPAVNSLTIEKVRKEKEHWKKKNYYCYTLFVEKDKKKEPVPAATVAAVLTTSTKTSSAQDKEPASPIENMWMMMRAIMCFHVVQGTRISMNHRKCKKKGTAETEMEWAFTLECRNGLGQFCLFEA
jgi:hypothetical protein